MTGFAFPPEFTAPGFLGLDDQPTTFRHKLVALARFLFLHQVSHLNQNPVGTNGPPHKRLAFLTFALDAILTPNTPSSREMATERVDGTDVLMWANAATDRATALAEAHLWPAKLTSQPGQLSAGEYLALIRLMAYFTDLLASDADSERWTELWQVQQQCAVCPALFDYEVEEGQKVE